MCPASAEDKYYVIRLISVLSKKRKKLKTHVESHRDPACYTTLQMRNVVILVIFRFWTL